MDTTEIIMISKIYHHHHLESSPQAQLLYFNCKSNEVSGKLPVWSPSERYSKPKQDPITTILAQVCCHLPTKTQQVQHFNNSY